MHLPAIFLLFPPGWYLIKGLPPFFPTEPSSQIPAILAKGCKICATSNKGPSPTRISWEPWNTCSTGEQPMKPLGWGGGLSSQKTPTVCLRSSYLPVSFPRAALSALFASADFPCSRVAMGLCPRLSVLPYYPCKSQKILRMLTLL